MFLQQLSKINTFIFDIDGVLTNGSILASDSGEYLRTFNIKDGYALQLAVKRGYHVCVVSGGQGLSMQRRFEGLGLKDIFLGVSDKVAVYQNLLDKYALGHNQILYMGDDIPDLTVMKLVGLPTCPADAAEEIKAISTYISPVEGGRGAARDIIQKVLRSQGKWYDEQPAAVDSGK